MVRKKFSRLLAGVAAAFIITVSLPVTAFGLTPDLTIYSDAYVVMDAASGQVLIEKNMNKQKAPASITKIMTLALALERCNMDDIITVSQETVNSIEAGSTHIALVPGEQITFRDAVMGTQLISANDAANVVAEHAGGSISAFVDLMNAKVAELGLTGTHFVNPNGLDATGHYVTAYDMAAITRYAISVPGFREVFGETEYQMPPTNIKSRDYVFYAQNAVMFPENAEYYEGIEGSKLGYTYNANHTLVALAKQGNMELIVVALDSTGKDQKYDDMATLLDYCFAHYETMTLRAKELQSMEVPIASVERPTDMVQIAADEDYVFVVPLGTSKSSLEIRYNVPELYKSERTVDPTFSVYSPNGELLFSAPLSYTIQAVERSAEAAPTQSVPKDDRLLALLILAIKCLCVLLGVLVVLLLTVRTFIMLNYRKKQKEIQRKKQEALARRQRALQRQRDELRRREIAELAESRTIRGDPRFETPPPVPGLPNNVTIIHPNRKPPQQNQQRGQTNPQKQAQRKRVSSGRGGRG